LIANVNRRIAEGVESKLAMKLEVERHKKMEVGKVKEVDCALTDQYACDYDGYYGIGMGHYYNWKEPVEIKVIGERNLWEGKECMVGMTGRLGYHVPKADQLYNISMMGRYVSGDSPLAWGQEKEVCVNKKFVVPRKMEELICVETHLNACSPLRKRESPGTSIVEFKGKMVPHRTHQFAVVAWQSKKNLKCGEKLWRMGYVMNDMGGYLRIMVPNGRWFILHTKRVVHFDFAIQLANGRDQYDGDVPDKKFMSEDLINSFTDNDWYFPEDEDACAKDTPYSVNFVKDEMYPLRGAGFRCKRIKIQDN
jgi:hypothetical protein